MARNSEIVIEVFGGLTETKNFFFLTFEEFFLCLLRPFFCVFWEPTLKDILAVNLKSLNILVENGRHLHFLVKTSSFCDFALSPYETTLLLRIQLNCIEGVEFPISPNFSPKVVISVYQSLHSWFSWRFFIFFWFVCPPNQSFSV